MNQHEFLQQVKDDLQIIGIAGNAQTGKDTLAKVAIAHGFLPVPFALQLKIAMVNEGAAFDKMFLLPKDDQTRKALQIKGHDHGRLLNGPNYWVDQWATMVAYLAANGVYKFVVPDVRYMNEAKMLHNIGAKVYLVTPEAIDYNVKRQWDHPSEQDIGHFPVDGTVVCNHERPITESQDAFERLMLRDFDIVPALV